jgi:hypothetical protein
MSKLNAYLKKAVTLAVVACNAEIQKHGKQNTKQLARLNYLVGYLKGGQEYFDMASKHYEIKGDLR